MNLNHILEVTKGLPCEGCENSLRCKEGLACSDYVEYLGESSPKGGPSRLHYLRVFPNERREGFKVCGRCWKEKPLDDFHKCAEKNDGRAYRCKECVSKIQKEALAKAKESKARQSDNGTC